MNNKVSDSTKRRDQFLLLRKIIAY